MKPEFDEVSGQHTTGHEWNGIKELDTPMPKAFHIWLWGSIAVAALLWVLYPSFPGISNYLDGTLDYSSRLTVTHSVEEGQRHKADAFAAFETGDLESLAQDASLREIYEPSIAVLFRDNCAACHGRDAAGQGGFPNLLDDHWLWSGSLEEIEYTLQVGINTSHDDTRFAQMPAFGRNGLLEEDQIEDVIDFVLKISGQEHGAEAATRGADVFAENCSSCHGDDGRAGFENGAPDLTDATWLYGGDRATLAKTLNNGRAGVMPAWSERLTESEIRQLTLYVHWANQDAQR
ncbi:Cytochrome c oxidase subunit III [Cognatishimia activa]|uniref:Cbb3-type cytochrome c oxidase subunit n=1 Tax=Cognatishimia activa TaxID=1715691 RepID=A0A0P1J108_9RHOB|nr:cytochrome-c oxidase, cbb3-type subunit III [Cognatishimia activa]CUK27518.1 Cytochrome c oxidase subunit III [Cognatishimia activa]